MKCFNDYQWWQTDILLGVWQTQDIQYCHLEPGQSHRIILTAQLEVVWQAGEQPQDSSLSAPVRCCDSSPGSLLVLLISWYVYKKRKDSFITWDTLHTLFNKMFPEGQLPQTSWNSFCSDINVSLWNRTKLFQVTVKNLLSIYHTESWFLWR